MTPPSHLVLGSFIGDALALGPHWVYDRSQILSHLGRVTHYHPPMTQYHPGKSAGDFTHYGDQMLVLLRSIVEQGEFNLSRFAADWRAFWENPACISYRDGATKATLANLQSGASLVAAASGSHDMAGAAKGAPLFLLRWANDDDLIHATRSLTAFTHGDPTVIDAAEFFTRVALAVQRGQSIPAAVKETLVPKNNITLRPLLDAAVLSARSAASDPEALESHGLSCDVSDGFAGICHLLLRHPDDPAGALIENASAGGDSAARGMILGWIYGAGFPTTEWPSEWISELRAGPEIQKLINKIA
jgi:ADP-ribosylglycohydrolase